VFLNALFGVAGKDADPTEISDEDSGQQFFIGKILESRG
jgi:hypothetical protein